MIIEEDLTDGVVRLRNLDPKAIGEEYLSWLFDSSINQYLEIRHNLPKSVSELQQYVQSVNDSDNTLMFGIFS